MQAALPPPRWAPANARAPARSAAARTLRYAVRQDTANTQLRGGAVAAFALVRAAGGFDLLQRAAAAAGGGGRLAQLLTPDVLGPAALYAGQCMLAFGFAAAALEAAFNAGAIKRMRGSATE